MLLNKTIARRLLPQIPLKILFVLLLFLASLLALGIVIQEVMIDKEEKLDLFFYGILPKSVSAKTIHTMQVISFFGSGIFLIPAYFLMITYSFRQKKYLQGIHTFIIAISGYALVHGLKELFARARPGSALIETLKNYSFPSGHTASAFIFCSIVIYLFSKSNQSIPLKWLVFLIMVTYGIFVGISRIILKVHYPTDVLAGATVGVVWVILGFWLLNKLKFIKIKGKEYRRNTT